QLVTVADPPPSLSRPPPPLLCWVLVLFQKVTSSRVRLPPSFRMPPPVASRPLRTVRREREAVTPGWTEKMRKSGVEGAEERKTCTSAETGPVMLTSPERAGRALLREMTPLTLNWMVSAPWRLLAWLMQ